MNDSDHGTLKGILRSRTMTDQTLTFLHEVDVFDIKTVHNAFERARAHCKLLAQDLFDADAALQLRAKSGPPAGPLFEQEAAETDAASRAELEREILADDREPEPDAPPAEVEKKKRGRPKKRAPEGPPAETSPEPPAKEANPERGAVTYELRRDQAVGGATYACRLVASTEGTLPVMTGLSRPLEAREMPSMTPENLPSLAYDETPAMLGWAAGQLKAIEGEG